ncbi:hypothetical protein ACQEVS_10205 [Streptomyces sp. CA-181903]|uniref:hypothetical protein n=1 Tax=Streptomyces sp. CA-181903 TaxID=3240055 RepID=UPI003D933967
MSSTALTPPQAAAVRARIIAETARIRYVSPRTKAVLRSIATHLDAAATAFEQYTGATNAPFAEAEQALTEARALVAQHRDTQFPVNFTDYITAPLSGCALPMPPALDPVASDLAQHDSDLRHCLERMHYWLDRATTEAATDAWLPSALAYQRALAHLAEVVAAEDARPSNQPPAR